MVVNLSKDKGKFSGGSNVTYLGAYTESVIEGGEGKTTFAGYFNKMESVITKGRGIYSGVFEETTLAGSEASDTYSGYFSNVTIDAGKGHNNFNGLFLGGSSVTGGDDGNAFNGRFIDSTLKSGAGDDKVGRHVNLAGQSRVVAESGEEYTGLAADIINSLVDTGEGNDTVTAVTWKSDVQLNDGDNKISGIFTESSVKAGAGNDLLAVMYSNASSFDLGDGADSAVIGTAAGSSIRTGEGSASIIMGNNKNKNRSVEGGSLMGADAALASTSFQTYGQRLNGITGMEYGELSGNNISAETGENLIRVYTGEGTETIRTGSRNTNETDTEGSENAVAVEDPQEIPEASAESAKELASQAAAMDTARKELSIIENVTGTVLQAQQQTKDSSGKTKKMRNALERYARQSGPGATFGSTGVFVTTGVGETLTVNTFDRSYSEGRPEPNGIHRTTRRATGLGEFRWDASWT